MSDLRDRMRVLDGLDVPDVMAQAHAIGPKPPLPEPGVSPTRRIAIVAFALLIAFVALAVAARILGGGVKHTPAKPIPFGSLSGTVVFERQLGQHQGIWVVRPDGTGEHQLKDLGPNARRPSISPDGNRLLYSRCATAGLPDCTLEIVNLEGHHRGTAFDCPTRDCYGDEASWSPDGSEIVFARFATHGPGRLPNEVSIVVGPVGGPFRALTHSALGPDGAADSVPQWSPDGRSIVFERLRLQQDRVTSTAIFTVGVDGGRSHQVTPWRLDASDPSWSPDGRSILFTTHGLDDFPDASTSNIYTVRPDGSGLTQITHFAGGVQRAGDATWIEGEDMIVFPLLQVSSHDRPLYVMRADGSGVLQVLDGFGGYTQTRFQPG